MNINIELFDAFHQIRFFEGHYEIHEGLNSFNCAAEGLVMETTHSNKRIKLSYPGTSIDNPPAEPNPGSSEQANLHYAPLDDCKHGCTDEFRTDNSSFSDGTDKEQKIYEMNFGNLSAELKV